MILDFEHKPSSHCESGVTANLLKFHGVKEMNEPLVLGISSGLFFSYIPLIKLQFAPLFAYRILPGQIFARTVKSLGIKMYRKRFKDPKESMDELDQTLDRGLPVGLQVGIFDLPFFPPEYRQQYNMHNLIIYGKENNEYMVGDPTVQYPQRISYDDLMHVRYPQGPFSPKGKMYYPVVVPDNIDLREPIVKGIKKTAWQMTKIPINLVGTKGMRKLSRQMANWPETLGIKTANYYMGQVLRMQEEIGTGGGGFRYMFGHFLSQAAERLEQDWLKEMSIEMGKIGSEWRNFAYMGSKNCKSKTEIEVPYPELAKMLYDLSIKEDQFFTKLSRISLKK